MKMVIRPVQLWQVKRLSGLTRMEVLEKLRLMLVVFPFEKVRM